MKRSGPLKRHARLRSANPERRAARMERDFGKLAEHIRTLPCCVCGKGSDYTQACHVKSRGAGGHAWLDDGAGNLIPMCATHHGLQHLKGWGELFDGGQAEAALLARSLGDNAPSWVFENS